MNSNPSKEKKRFSRRIEVVEVRKYDSPDAFRLSPLDAKAVLVDYVEQKVGREIALAIVGNDGSFTAIGSGQTLQPRPKVSMTLAIPKDEYAAIMRGRITPDKIAPASPPCPSAAEEATGTSFKGARESLMQAYGASPDTVRKIIDPFDESPGPDWYHQLKVRAIQYKEMFGTVRTKHMLAVGAGVQSLQDLRYVSDGSKRATAFIKLLDADLAVREATNKCLDVKAEQVDGDDII
jgi:hypothetical protein